MPASQPGSPTRPCSAHVVHCPGPVVWCSTRPGEEPEWHGKEGKPTQTLHVTILGAGSSQGRGTARRGTNWAACARESPTCLDYYMCQAWRWCGGMEPPSVAQGLPWGSPCMEGWPATSETRLPCHVAGTQSPCLEGAGFMRRCRCRLASDACASHFCQRCGLSPQQAAGLPRGAWCL